MTRPLLIDWYCCEGGAAWGYHLAGFDVIGVDHKPQRKYPFEVLVCDALSIPDRLLAAADAHHASPPCQAFTDLNNDKTKHINLIPQTREKLIRLGKPYTIENVRRAREHLIDPISILGTAFDMHMVTSAGQRFDLSRERLFETNWPLMPPWCPEPANPIANVFGGHLRARGGDFRTGGKTGRTKDFEGEDRRTLARALMEMPWATMGGMSEAVPPPYTDFIGTQLMAHIEQRRIAA